jgi:hypothetical protein
MGKGHHGLRGLTDLEWICAQWWGIIQQHQWVGDRKGGQGAEKNNQPWNFASGGALEHIHTS